MRRPILLSWLRSAVPVLCVIVLLATLTPVALGSGEEPASVFRTPPDRGDLSIEKSVRTGTYLPGSEVVFDIKIGSHGLQTAEGIQVTDVINPLLVIDRVWISRGRLKSIDGNTVVASVGDLLPRREATVTIWTHLRDDAPPGAVIWNDATVSWSIGERTPMTRLSKPVTFTVATPPAPEPAPPEPEDQTPTPFDRLPLMESNSNRWYFAETGHSLAYGFLSFWKEHNGQQNLGLPISEEMDENGRVVQYFERAKLEYWPENPVPYNVLVADLGRRLYEPTPPVPAGPSTQGHRYFAETGHWVHTLFLDYWQSNGGLAIFGYPIREQEERDGRLIQIFERARLEYHPENEGTPHIVQLGLLGWEYLESVSPIE